MSNVITVSFGCSSSVRSVPLYQYDYGIKLKFGDLDLPTAYEVHFSNTMNGEAIVQVGDDSGVSIPNELLATGSPVYAWTVLHTGMNDGETVYKVTIPIILRAEPPEIVPTPSEQSAIAEAIEALNSAIEQTGASEANARASEEAASQSELNAKASEDNAEAFALDALSYRNAAAQSATDAQTSATASATSASNASSSASTASAKATEASGYASTASTKASEAAASATLASNKASAAAASATLAESAKDDAEDARDRAESAAARIPEAPTTAGTYELRAVVTNGSVSYVWIEAMTLAE